MTIEALEVAIKDGIQNNSSRLGCELERPKLVSSISYGNSLLEGKIQETKNLEDRKIFILSLRETEMLGVNAVNYDLDCALCWALSAPSTHIGHWATVLLCTPGHIFYVFLQQTFT